ncbi:ATP-grasp domain-containing protein [Chitinophaga japonensis]|uniref:Glutathione synthetase-like protein n=1 Tax=Chitinophaga japonensis TaxID=104662 RepID=A0A562T5H2_CHIJA|nr:hypothetical protein [Chitinophaga japonensis]TWI88752.1 glutathione synthetase-like protein [Chitinophaga japonensis]
MKIAYVCYETQEQYSAATQEDEESLLLALLQQKGLQISRVIWTDESVRWEDYDLVLVKSPWDYHEKIGQFYRWLDRIAALGIWMLNPHPVIKWNSDKHYLQDIAQAGYPVIPSAIIESGAPTGLAPFFQQFNTTQLIVKPCISAGARHTYTITPQNLQAMQDTIAPLLQQEAFLVQPYVKEIETAGEWSFIFLDGQFSHCVVKRPRSGDFRVQFIHGGTAHADLPPETYIQSAAAYVERFAPGCLYARVDAVMLGDTLTLMELELIEPYLFLGAVAGGYESYYRALAKRIAERQHTLSGARSINPHNL